MNIQPVFKYATLIGFALLGTLLIIWPAIYNGYPLVYSDTETYLRSSVQLIPPVDRPIGYGLFIRIMSWQATTWTVVIGQGLIAYWVTFRVVKLFFKHPRLPHFIILLFLSAISSLPWYAGQVMPDFFAGIVVLTIFLFYYDTKTWKNRIIYGFLIAFFAIFHYSFILIFFLTASFLLIVRIRKAFKTDRGILYRYIALMAIFGTSILFVMLYNYADRGKFKFSFSSNVFLVAKFCDGNILNTYLQDNCGKKDIPFCDYKDTVMDSPMGFLWYSEWPFQKQQMHQDWEKINERCGVIVHDVLTIPKYRNMYIKEAFRATMAQLLENRIGSGLRDYGDIHGVPGNEISSNFEGDLQQYLTAKQNQTGMEDLSINIHNQRTLLISTLIILAGLSYRPVRQKIRDLLLVCLAGVVFNAFVTAALANVYDRLQARITWLLIFGALMVILSLIKANKPVEE